jgi:hypothetical protein
VNSVLQQVLYRRRLRRRTRQAGAVWVLFGGLHIAVWWAAFNAAGTFGPAGTSIFQVAVWPLLLAATISFITMIVYGLRWLYAPGDVGESDRPEQTEASRTRIS